MGIGAHRILCSPAESIRLGLDGDRGRDWLRWSVMITLGLSDDHLLDCGLSNGMVIRSVRIDGILPRGLLILTLGLAVDDLGKGTYASEICEVTLRLVTCGKSKTHCSRNLCG